MPEIVCSRCGKTAKNLQGWKSHMSRTHGGYDDADLAEAAGVSTGEGNVRERMAAFATQLPGPEAGETASSPSDAGGEAAGSFSSGPVPIAPSTERRVRATPKKLRKILGGIPAKILEQLGIELDHEDSEALDEAGEFMGDIFGFEFSVPESKVLVQSRWWAILWVAGVAGLVYIKHRFPEVAKAFFKGTKKDEGQETEASGKMDNGS